MFCYPCDRLINILRVSFARIKYGHLTGITNTKILYGDFKLEGEEITPFALRTVLNGVFLQWISGVEFKDFSIISVNNCIQYISIEL